MYPSPLYTSPLVSTIPTFATSKRTLVTLRMFTYTNGPLVITFYLFWTFIEASLTKKRKKKQEAKDSKYSTASVNVSIIPVVHYFYAR